MPAALSLADQVAIVTGASGSIGRATALVLADWGADVVLAGRDGATLDAVHTEIIEAGGRSLSVQCDVAEAADVANLIAACVTEFGPPDVLVANAGTFQAWGPTEELSTVEWQRIIDVDLTGVLLCCQEAGREMIRAGRGGAMVLISSVAGLTALPGASAYVAAKAGVAGLTRTLACEWAQHRIRVNALAPGFIRRDPDPWRDRPEQLAEILACTPLGRLGDPHEVALAVAFLASGAAAYITGAVLPVDGGRTAR